MTKCHVEACAFWKDQKEKESSKKPLPENEGPKKMKTIDQYFVKPLDPSGNDLRVSTSWFPQQQSEVLLPLGL